MGWNMKRRKDPLGYRGNRYERRGKSESRLIDDFRQHLANWRTNPKKRDIAYILSRLRGILGAHLFEEHAGDRSDMLDPPIFPVDIEILYDPKFLDSVDQVRDHTCLDVARLANLWTMARLVGPGAFLEVGSYRGGTALHICNAIDEYHAGAHFYCFDPFETGGFERIVDCDQCFEPTDFMGTSYDAVVKLLSSKPNAKVFQGYFPASAEGLNLKEVCFCHLDVDVYEATRNSLVSRLAPRSLIMVDDLGNREAQGVKKAVNEFLETHPSFLLIPTFPSQGILLPKHLW
jgi:O-methyltransferase